MNNVNEGKISKVAINLDNQLNEDFMKSFGDNIKRILKRMIYEPDSPPFPLSIKGDRRKVKSFVEVLAREKDYLEAFKDRGEDHYDTQKKKLVLDKTAAQFERLTGIPWPFK